MVFSRRNFLKGSALTAAGLSAGLLGACGGGTSTAASSAAPQPTAAPTATPTPTPTPEPPYNADVLTGEERAADAADSRIIGIMINNISNNSYQNARPQRGLSSAKMLMEIMVEGGITRMCALFDDVSAIPEIGPVRSGRDQFLQLLIPWQALYYHIGESVFCTRFIKDWQYSDLNIGGMSYFDTPTHQTVFHRDSRGRKVATEHTAFTSGEEVQKAIDKAGIDMARTYTSTFFKFADYRYQESNALDGCESATSVTIRHSLSYRTYFTYDEASATYKMSQYSAADKAVSATCDELNGEQLAFANLVVLFTTIKAYPGDSHDIQSVDYTVGGVGYYFTNGRVRTMYWRKGSPGDCLAIYDPTTPNEDLIVVNRGKTYLTVVSLDEAANFNYTGSDAAASSDDLTGADSAASTLDDADGSESAAASISTN